MIDGMPTILRIMLALATATLCACSSDHAGGGGSDGGSGDGGGVADPTLFYRSGSRLRARVVQGDGSPVF
jgi:hypothetical protein